MHSSNNIPRPLIVTSLIASLSFGCSGADPIPVEEYSDASDVPTPSDDLDDVDDNTDTGLSDTGSEEEDEDDEEEATVVEYTFTDAHSLIYVQVWKNEDAWGSDFAHDHVMRGDNWEGTVSINLDDPSDCSFRFVVPTRDLAVDEDSMRDYVGYGDSIESSDRSEIRSNMLDSSQLNADSHDDITFEGSECSGNGGDSGNLKVTGKWTVAGGTHTETETLTYQVQNGSLYVQGTYNFSHNDFAIEPFEAYGGLVRNDDPLRITIDAVGYPE